MSFVSTYSAASIRAWQSPSRNWVYSKDIPRPSVNANSFFGNSTAIDASGNYAVIGAQDPIANGKLTVVSGLGLANTTTLTPTYPGNNKIGLSVAINDSGNVIVSTDVVNDKVAIFTRASNTWTDTQTITLSNISSSPQGCTIDGSGDYIAVGENGNALVYLNTANVWSLQQSIPITTAFTWPVKLNGNGDYLIAGDLSTANGIGRIFNRVGATWSLQANITPSSPIPGQGYAEAVTINDSGDVILVGAPQATISGNLAAGAVYVYNRTGSSWSQTQIITPNDTAPQQAFGVSISLNANGNTAMIGAYAFDGSSGSQSNNQGKVYYFQNINNTWQQTQSFQSPNIAGSEFFGSAVAMNKNDLIAVIGAPGNDVGNTNVGAAYVYVNQ
jgi:hypothetical protein